MQTRSALRGTRLLALLLALMLLVSLMPISVLAASKAVPEKITLVGSDEALEYEYVDDLIYSWEDIPRYKVYVPTGTKSVQLHGTVYIDGSAGSGYCSEKDLDPNNNFYNFEYWTTGTVGSAAPYTIETRTDGAKTQNMAFVKLKSYVGGSSDAYILQFEEKEVLDAAPAPTITTNLSTETVSRDYYGDAYSLSVAATVPEGGNLSYQWQVSTTSATDGFTDIPDATGTTYSATPSDGLLGNFWYRVVVTNTVEGMASKSVTSAVTPVTVTSSFLHQVTIKTGKGAGALHVELKDASGYANTVRKSDTTDANSST